MTDFASILSTVILLTTVASLVIALAAYFAYKVRESRKPAPSGGEKPPMGVAFAPIFLKRHIPNGVAPDESGDNS